MGRSTKDSFYRRRSFAELAELAATCRQRWGLKGNRPDLLRILREELPKEDPRFRLRVFVADRKPGTLAYTLPAKNQIWISTEIEQGAEQRRDFEMNVLGEEIAHRVLDHPGMRFRSLNDVRLQLAFPDIDQQEHEAKLFQSLIIAALDEALKCESIDELVEQFGLDEEAALVYFEELKLLRRKKQTESTRLIDNRNHTQFAEPKADLIVDLSIPSQVSDLMLDVAQGSPRGRSILLGQASDGTFRRTEVLGSERNLLVPFAGSRIYVIFVRGDRRISITPVRWNDCSPPLVPNIPNTAQALEYAEARAMGFEDDPCDDCGRRTKKRDGNRLTCQCGWTDSTS